MKKFTKSIAIICSLLFASFTLVACGSKDNGDNGNKGLVDTNANYQAYDDSFASEMTVGSCASAMTNDSLSDNETYAIRLVYTSSTGATPAVTEEITGNIAKNGDFSLNIKTVSSSNTSYSFNSSIIYDASERTAYIDYMGYKYITTVPQGQNPFAAQYVNYVFPFTFDQTNPKGIQAIIDNLTKKPENNKTITGIAKADNYAKLRYEGTSAIAIPDITANCTIYTVFDREVVETAIMDVENFTFVGAKVEISFNSDDLTYNGSLEIAKSTNSVKTLTDDEKSQYSTSD